MGAFGTVKKYYDKHKLTIDLVSFALNTLLQTSDVVTDTIQAIEYYG